MIGTASAATVLRATDVKALESARVTYSSVRARLAKELSLQLFVGDRETGLGQGNEGHGDERGQQERLFHHPDYDNVSPLLALLTLFKCPTRGDPPWSPGLGDGEGEGRDMTKRDLLSPGSRMRAA